MPLVGLRGVFFVFLLLSLSTNPADASLPTNEKEPKLMPQPQSDLNGWKEKSAILIHQLPGLLTKSEKGRFALKLLNPGENNLMKNQIKDEIYRMIKAERLGRLCNFFKQMRLKVVKRIARAKFKVMKHQVTKHRMRGLLPRMFSSVNVPRYKQGRNRVVQMKIRSLARHCSNQTTSMDQEV